MHRRARAGLATLVGALLVATAARGDEPGPPIRLAWVRAEGAESCANFATIVEGVIRRLGRDPFTADARRSIEGVVSRDGTRWVARLYVREADGTLEGSRELASEAEACDAIGEAVTLAMALAIDPEAAMRVAAAEAVPSPAPVVPTPVAPLPTPAPPVVPTGPSTPARPGVRGGLALHAVGVFGVLPAPSAGFDITGDVFVTRRVRVSVGMLFVPEIRPPSPNDLFAFGLTSAVVRGCVDAVQSPLLSLAGCGGAFVGGVHALEPGRPSLRPGQQVWGAVSAEVRATLRLVGPLVVDVGGGLVVPITRYRFFLEGSDRTLFQQPAVAASAYAGLGIDFR